MEQVSELVKRYIAAWNETDDAPRRKLVSATWVEDGSYLDAHRGAKGVAAIDAMIKSAQEQYPGYRLQLVKNAEAHNDRVRFLWHAGGTPEAPVHLVGADFGVIAADGRFESVTGFSDIAPGGQ